MRTFEAQTAHSSTHRFDCIEEGVGEYNGLVRRQRRLGIFHLSRGRQHIGISLSGHPLLAKICLLCPFAPTSLSPPFGRDRPLPPADRGVAP